jgi:uncharacterized SAM-binding protein YcdF (DUF218 family)
MTGQRQTVGRVFGRYVLGSVLVAALVVAGAAVRVAATAGVDQRDPVDAILVLGAAQYDGDPSTIFRARLDHALTLYREGVASYIVTVGGSRAGDTFTEAASGRAYLLEQGLPAEAVDAVGEGNDTLVSLRAGAEALHARGLDSVVLVTDPWHAHRSSVMARDLDLTVEVSSVDRGPAAGTSVAPRYLLRETLGTLYYRLVGGSSGLGYEVL